VSDHLDDLVEHPIVPSDIRGGQTAADRALARCDLTGYAKHRNNVYPTSQRGATGLSPYIRHGLLQLPELWHLPGPAEDVASFRNELLWQEYARHLYARVGSATRANLRFDIAVDDRGDVDPWDTEARCIAFARDELHTRGWLTNQTRMWLASHWTVRSQAPWQRGEDWFFRYLLDGSRAANRLGWQWTVGALTGRPYGFSRWQVETRAPGLCDQCVLQDTCPIQDPPDIAEPMPVADPDPALRRAQPRLEPENTCHDAEPEMVWLTAESLGDQDPALAEHPDLPAVFVFDLPLLRSLRLSAQRLVFLAECLADLATRRTVRIGLGDPVEVLRGIPLAATAAPVPGWHSRARHLSVVAHYPWPWLVEPVSGPVTSFSAWRRSARR
jgi:deoxyribodipyrimidine photo-lyase